MTKYKYNINRKYNLSVRGAKSYEMLDIGVVEDERNPIEILKELDQITKEYCRQFDEPFPDKKEDTRKFIASKQYDPDFQEANKEAEVLKELEKKEKK